MKYPSIDTFVKLNFTGDNITVDNIFELASTCIDQVYEDEEVYDLKNFTKKEVNEFLESMKSDQFLKLQNFFAEMPKLEYDIEVENPNTGVKSTVKLEGLGSFFE
jgi:hypothetical protein